ncbi:MAG TPA: sigma-70 family RNA polymerase sigma factor, partial [Miltoncostaea sp.]|nr:sigma-70 family RNA polymerase sigma factor [Miltoncostaea sp.]
MSTATPPRDGISFDGGDGRGLEAAFESLYRGHRERVLRLCRAMVGHPQDAEEAAQATMLSAYRALERGDRPGVVGAWLTTIARNECRDLIGRRRVEVPLPDALPAVTSDPAELVERRERMRELRHDLAELPRGQRTAIVLRSMAGMRHSEIAEVVGGSEQAARTLVYEARESLAEFAEGRALGCAEVRPRIDSGDGRALRARRVRAHIRVCEGCREAAAAQRGGRIGGWLPVPGILAALRGLFGGGAAVPVAGGVALVSLVTAGALVVPGPWDPSGPADASPAVATTAAAQGSRAPAANALAAPVSAGSASTAPSGARSARTAVAGTAPTGTLVTPAAGVTAPDPSSADPSAAHPSSGDPSAAPASPVVRVRATGGASPASGVTVAAPGVSATVSGSGVSADVAGVGVSAGSGGVAVTSPAANVSV